MTKYYCQSQPSFYLSALSTSEVISFSLQDDSVRQVLPSLAYKLGVHNNTIWRVLSSYSKPATKLSTFHVFFHDLLNLHDNPIKLPSFYKR